MPRIVQSEPPGRPHLGTLLVGRERELADLSDVLTRVLAGQGQVVLLVGEPGIGKTRLATETVQLAKQRGVRALWGSCHPWAGAPPYWPWIAILRRAIQELDPAALQHVVGHDAAALAQLLPELHDHLPGLPTLPPLEPEQARFRLFSAVTDALLHLATNQPLLLVLDDLHWADTPSLLLIPFLTTAIRSAPIMVVGTYRNVEIGGQHPLAATLADLAREPHQQRLLLHGLTREDVARFIAALCGCEPSAALVDAVNYETDGNPFFMAEVIRLLVADDRLTSGAGPGGWRLQVPESVRDVIRRRLDQRSALSTEILTVAAVIGREFDLVMLARLSARPTEQLLDGLDEALQARLIKEREAAGFYRFSHALMQDTLYDLLPTARRLQLHYTLAEGLVQLHAAHLSPYYAVLAHHFAEAAPLAGAEQAIAFAMCAGDQAMAQFAWESAIDQYQRALRAVAFVSNPDPARFCAVLLALGEAQNRAERHAQGSPTARATFQRAAEAARAACSEEFLARAALGIEGANLMVTLGGAPQMALLEEALEQLPPADAPLRARLLARLANHRSLAAALGRRHDDQALPTDAWHLSGEAVAMARRLGDGPTLAYALLNQHVARWVPDTLDERIALATEAIAVAEACGDTAMFTWGYLLRIWDLAERGDVEQERRDFTTYVEVLTRLHSPLLHDWGLATQYAIYALREGRYAEAEELVQRGLEGLSFADFPQQLFLLRRDQDRLAELEPAIRELVRPDASFEGVDAVLRVVLATDLDRDNARSLFEDIVGVDHIALPVGTYWLHLMALLAEVCAKLEDRERAHLLSTRLRPYADRNAAFGGTGVNLGSMAHYLGLLATTRRDWDEAGQHFAQALANNTRMQMWPCVAASQHACAEMLVKKGGRRDRERARELLDQAFATVRELGMVRLERRVAPLLATLEQPAQHTRDRHDGPAEQLGLSAREVEVLRLIVAGKTDQDIADRLFISRRTVTTHVSSILNKLGVSSRLEAATTAVRHGLG